MNGKLLAGSVALLLVATLAAPLASANYLPCTEVFNDPGVGDAKETLDHVSCQVVSPVVGLTLAAVFCVLGSDDWPDCPV